MDNGKHTWEMAVVLMGLYKDAYIQRGLSEDEAVEKALDKAYAWLEAQDLDDSLVTA